jgi:hypothetical protein
LRLKDVLHLLRLERAIEELDFVDRTLKSDRTDVCLPDAEEEPVGNAPRSGRGVEGVHQRSVDVELAARCRCPVDRRRDVMPVSVADEGPC